MTPLTGDLSNAALAGTLVTGGQGPTGPAGATGAAGHTPEISVASTTTGAAGTDASVSANTNEDGDVSLSFTIPRGATGSTGATGAQGPGHGGVILVNTIYHRARHSSLEQLALASAAANRIYLSEFQIYKACTLDKIVMLGNSNSVLSGKNMKFVVYSMGTNGCPADKLYESSAIALSNSATLYSKTSIGLSLSAGSVWAGMVFDSAIGASSGLTCAQSRVNTQTNDQTDSNYGSYDGLYYDDSYSSPRSTALDTNVTRNRANGTGLPLVLLGLTP